jgi:hypothetical protein
VEGSKRAVLARAGPEDRKEDAMTNYPTGVLEGLSPEELAEYYATWERLRANASSESEKHEIDEVFSRVA